jgi:6-hydroxycyclohex-1-ene-1-carbonyl-CoA dehydrogenase
VTVIHGAYGFQLRAPGSPLERVELPPLEPVDDQVVVEVAGCGVCHTDIGFAVDGVPTRHPLPLILGHEISGRVIAAGEVAQDWIGRAVIVPAVIPCQACPACEVGRPTICRRQFMPGNHGHGGFATHVLVPSRGLCAVPDSLPEGLALPLLSVVADAVTTPLEAIRRAALSGEDVAVFIGVGGVGGFGVQLASALGAAVVAIDVDSDRLALAAQHGADLVLSANDLELKEVKRSIRTFVGNSGRGGLGLKIFETSGTSAGQQMAFGLLDPGAHLAVVGFHMGKLELRLSNLMAFDATARGNWGSAPERYPEALELVLNGSVVLGPYVESAPLDEAPTVVQAVADHRTRRRIVLVPGARDGRPRSEKEDA